MCLAVPARVIELRPDNMALVDLAGTQREISLMVLDEDAAIGDFVLVHVGYAIEKIDEEEARRSLELFRELDMLGEDLPPSAIEGTPAA
jgi:hydrogenase expression/formation protein HypC